MVITLLCNTLVIYIGYRTHLSFPISDWLGLFSWRQIRSLLCPCGACPTAYSLRGNQTSITLHLIKYDIFDSSSTPVWHIQSVTEPTFIPKIGQTEYHSSSTKERQSLISTLASKLAYINSLFLFYFTFYIFLDCIWVLIIY